MRRKYKKVAAICTATTVAVGSLTSCSTSNAETNETQSVTTSTENKTEETKAVSSANGKEEKEETVYVKADAKGSVNEITVSNWLKNGTTAGTLSDISELQNIKNIKGDEEFSADGQNLSWSANGNDIYYQGTTDKTLPVNIKVTYTLDGKEIEPADLAGKSGHVKMRFDYTNTQKQTVEVNGKQEEVNVPFAVMTGAVLDAKKFANVTVTNGKEIMSDGKNIIVAGLALPGLEDTLLSDLDSEYTKDLEIPDYVEVEADVNDFSINMTLSVVLNDLFNDVDTNNFNDLDEIKDKVKEMKDNFQKIVDGSSDLDDGVGTLSDGTTQLTDGAKELLDGAKQLKDGSGTLNSGAKKLAESTTLLNNSVTQLNTGAATLDKGAKTLDSKSKDLTKGAETLISSLNTAKTGSKTLSDGLGTLAKKTTELKNSIGQKDGLTDSVGKLKTGAHSLAKGFTKVDKTGKNPGALQASKLLTSGVNDVDDGVQQLVTKVNDLKTEVATQYTTYEGYQKALANDATKQATVKAILKAQDDKTLASYEYVLTNLKTVNEGLAQLDQLPELSGGYLTQYKDAVKNKVALTENKATIEATVAGQVDGALKVLATMKSQLEDKKLQSQLTALKNGTASLATGMEGLQKGIKALSDGASQLDTGLGKLNTAAKTLKTATSQLNDAVVKASSGATSLKDGLNKLAAGGTTLKTGLITYTDGVASVAGGASKLAISIKALNNATGKLDTATGTLYDGTTTIKDGTSSLYDGTSKLESATGELADGVGKLKDGTTDLKDGTKEYQDKAINKIADLVDDNFDKIKDKLTATVKAGQQYNSFTGINKDMDGTVKFIIETEAIGED